MNDIVIRVDGLSKAYRIGRLQQRRDDTLRDSLAGLLRRGPKPEPGDEVLWALKDVSFDVKRGEVVGIIGRNGAGKSTLLKILSRITEPTSGEVRLQGRVRSLLEVGTGFHPELTGRENIYLNGAILGMKRNEINRSFEEIVAFSEVERFLETPVKRYSSGMYVRLAFAVAAHMEPEILVVDEVLAVGDSEFQKKCLGKMSEVATGGRTVLFVSHNLSAIQRLCQRSLMLEHGHMIAIGDTHEIVARYVSSDAYTSRPRSWLDLSRTKRSGTGEATFSSVRFDIPNATERRELYTEDSVEFSLSIKSEDDRSVGSIAVIIFDQYGTKLVNADTVSLGQYVNLRGGNTVLRLTIDRLHLNSGVYTVGLWMADPTGGILDFIESAFGFQVVTPEVMGLGVKPTFDGVVSCQFRVETDR